jgi:2'-5' RNA ligase
MKLRTFIALEVPDVHRQPVAQYLAGWSKVHNQGINWVSSQNLHLTLLFIGDTHSGDIPMLKEELFRICLKTSAFEMKCLGFELFPARQPRLLWVKLDASEKGVFNFAKELNRSVRSIGYEPESKPLKLHITAARIKVQQPAWLEQEFMQSSLPAEPALYSTVTLYQSVLKPQGPEYIQLQQYDLKNK